MSAPDRPRRPPHPLEGTTVILAEWLGRRAARDEVVRFRSAVGSVVYLLRNREVELSCFETLGCFPGDDPADLTLDSVVPGPALVCMHTALGFEVVMEARRVVERWRPATERAAVAWHKNRS